MMPRERQPTTKVIAEQAVVATHAGPYGCSKCRFLQRGCARCRDPAFLFRKQRVRVPKDGQLQAGAKPQQGVNQQQAAKQRPVVSSQKQQSSRQQPRSKAAGSKRKAKHQLPTQEAAAPGSQPAARKRVKQTPAAADRQQHDSTERAGASLEAAAGAQTVSPQPGSERQWQQRARGQEAGQAGQRKFRSGRRATSKHALADAEQQSEPAASAPAPSSSRWQEGAGQGEAELAQPSSSEPAADVDEIKKRLPPLSVGAAAVTRPRSQRITYRREFGSGEAEHAGAGDDKQPEEAARATTAAPAQQPESTAAAEQVPQHVGAAEQHPNLGDLTHFASDEHETAMPASRRGRPARKWGAKRKWGVKRRRRLASDQLPISSPASAVPGAVSAGATAAFRPELPSTQPIASPVGRDLQATAVPAGLVQQEQQPAASAAADRHAEARARLLNGTSLPQAVAWDTAGKCASPSVLTAQQPAPSTAAAAAQSSMRKQGGRPAEQLPLQLSVEHMGTIPSKLADATGAAGSAPDSKAAVSLHPGAAAQRNGVTAFRQSRSPANTVPAVHTVPASSTLPSSWVVQLPAPGAWSASTLSQPAPTSNRQTPAAALPQQMMLHAADRPRPVMLPAAAQAPIHAVPRADSAMLTDNTANAGYAEGHLLGSSFAQPQLSFEPELSLYSQLDALRMDAPTVISSHGTSSALPSWQPPTSGMLASPFAGAEPAMSPSQQQRFADEFLCLSQPSSQLDVVAAAENCGKPSGDSQPAQAHAPALDLATEPSLTFFLGHMQGAAPAPVAQAGVSSPAPAPGAAPASRPQPAEADGELTAADTQAAVQDFREVSGQPDPGIEARPAAQHESPAAATLPNSSRPAGSPTTASVPAVSEPVAAPVAPASTPAASVAPDQQASLESAQLASPQPAVLTPYDDNQRQQRFLTMLQDNMQRRRQDKQSGAALPQSLSPFFKPRMAGLKKRFPVTPALKTAGLDPRTSLWEPPQSPFGLIEEQLYDNPWKLLLACLLLNKTTGVQVRKVLWKLLALISTPEAAVKADVSQIQDIIQPLGLFRKRALAIQRFSHEFLTKQWVNPMELHGIGQYAADAYYIFCRGEWESVQPTDKDLLRYHEWLKSTGGQGTGLQRDVAPALSPVLDQLNQA